MEPAGGSSLASIPVTREASQMNSAEAKLIEFNFSKTLFTRFI
jgi:hypothetical protein